MREQIYERNHESSGLRVPSHIGGGNERRKVDAVRRKSPQWEGAAGGASWDRPGLSRSTTAAAAAR